MTALSAAEPVRPGGPESEAEPITTGVDAAAGWDRRWGWACGVITLLASIQWALLIGTSYARWGLFRWIGVDWGSQFAQGRVLLEGPPEAIYDLARLRQAHQALLAYTADPSLPMLGGHVAYLPIFAWLFVPFAVVPPPLGYALWTLLQGIVAGLLAWRAASLFEPAYRPWVVALVVTAYPVVQALVLGQIMLVLAWALAECYLALRAGRDFRAGLWLSLLVLKPQYGLLVGLLLLWKRRWAAVGGALLGIGVAVVASVVVAGWPALEALPRALAEEGDFRARISPAAQPSSMLNWRALVLYAIPTIGDRRGMALTLGLGALTALCLVPVWRGAWRPRDRQFPLRFSALTLATLLSSYHSHLYGAALLVVPVASLIAEGWPSRLVRGAVGALVLVPTLLLAVTLLAMTGMLPAGQVPVAQLFGLLLLVCYGCLLAEAWRERRWAG